MRAAVVTTEAGFEVVEVPDPAPGPGELVLRVGACGICGSDLKAVHNMPAGLIMGHEFAGEVAAAGAGAEGWPEGTAACALPLIGCGSCPRCVAGEVAHCPGVDMLGVGGSPGAYAEYVRVSAREAFRLPEGVDLATGALVEPLAVGLHAMHRAGLEPGHRVLVMGAGPVGLAVVLWARHLGATTLVATDPVPARRAMAERLGATATATPEEVAGDGSSFDVVVECVGTPGMLGAAVAAAATHGRIVVAGVCTEPDPFVPVAALVKELTVRFAVYYRRQDYAITLDLLRQGRIDPVPLVTDHVDLDGFPAAFGALTHPTTQGKVLVHP